MDRQEFLKKLYAILEDEILTRSQKRKLIKKLCDDWLYYAITDETEREDLLRTIDLYLNITPN